jgi:mannose-6-phosphate isomerase-like protein (cupin superfamily)
LTLQFEPSRRRHRPNSRRYHLNCDEVLHVLQRRILHSVDDEIEELGPGDTASIPSGALHNARNSGDEEAQFVIAFPSADRHIVGE